MEWHSLKTEEVMKRLETDGKGLDSSEVRKRRENHGKNELESGEKVSWAKIFLSQFTSLLIILLIVAAVISVFIGSVIDASLIMIIVFLNGIFGFVQDYKAEKSIEALKKLSAPGAVVMRNGKRERIDSTDTVPGDLILLEQGNSVPADARITECSDLAVDESLLTGESSAVKKKDCVLSRQKPLAERKNMLFKNTTITRGRAKAVVVGTGMDTEVGKIAEQLGEVGEKKTPFQKEVDGLGKKIGLGILIVVCIVAATEFLTSQLNAMEIFLVSVSLAVAAVPEGLPAVVTLSLALGARKMLKKNTLVRKLPVVESLGSVDVICSDKTGTITENTMTVTRIYSHGKEYAVSGKGLEEKGIFEERGKKADPKDLEMILKCGILCNNSEKEGKKYFGDPTETALLISGKKAGMEKGKLEKEYPRTDEISFTSERKMMSTIHSGKEGKIMFTKGAPEVVLEKCSRIMENGKMRKLTAKDRKRILEKNDQFAEKALRVLGFACRKNPGGERNMVFIGMQAMIDPPRKEVKNALKDCRRAGIRVIMITGDNAKTAKAIGEEIDFECKSIITGSEMDGLSASELKKKVDEVDIFARVSPKHKTMILKSLQKKGHIVAMTGDGVNDAPALKNSDVGVSMGQKGTDVAQQSSEMILLDDNFKTIRDAVEEGRGIFDNIQKFVNYLLSANTGEVLVIFIASVLGMGLPLTAIMILWINLLTDGLPALALSMDPKSESVMSRRPRKKGEGVIDRRMIYSIVTMGTAMAVLVLILFRLSEGVAHAQTVAFTALVVFEMVRIQSVRSRYGTGVFSNRWLILAVISSLCLQLAVVYTPLSSLFGTAPLGPAPWMLITGGLVAFGIVAWIGGIVENRIFGDVTAGKGQ